MVGLTWPAPAGFNLSVKVVDELLCSAGDAVCLALGLANGLLEQLLVDVVAIACEVPLPDEGLLRASDGLQVIVEQVGALLKGQTMAVEETGFAVSRERLAVGKDFEPAGSEFEACVL